MVMTTFKGLKLDPFQVESFEKISRRESIIVSAPTGSGKTLLVDYAIHLTLNLEGLNYNQKNRLIYTSPIKALSNQKYRDFCHDYGKENIGIMTGDVSINREAPILIMTTEILRNILYLSPNDPLLKGLNFVVFDEIHYLNDPSRGVVWEESLILLPEEIPLILLSATIPNGQEIKEWLNSFKKERKISLITSFDRPVPLKTYYFDGKVHPYTGEIEIDRKQRKRYLKRQKKRMELHYELPLVFGNETFSPVEVLKELDLEFLPAIYFIFSRKACEKAAQAVRKSQISLLTEEEKNVIQQRIDAFRISISNTDMLTQIENALDIIHFGIAFHHAGCVPLLKEFIELLFADGLIKVLFATETFAMGLNLPAHSVIFHSLEKFDGIEFRYLTSSEFHQMAGRAGRRGLDIFGNAVVVLSLSGDEEQISSIIEGHPEPLESQFRLSYNAIANLLENRNENEIVSLLQSSFKEYSARKIRESKNTELQKQIQKLQEILALPLQCAKGLSSVNAWNALGRLATLEQEYSILRNQIKLDFNLPKLQPHFEYIWKKILPIGRVIIYQEDMTSPKIIGILIKQLPPKNRIMTENTFFAAQFLFENGETEVLLPSEYDFVSIVVPLEKDHRTKVSRLNMDVFKQIEKQLKLEIVKQTIGTPKNTYKYIAEYFYENKVELLNQRPTEEFETIELFINENPCKGCEFFEEHNHLHKQRQKYLTQLHQLETRLIESQNLSYVAFQRMVKVLEKLKFYEDGYLTQKGHLLSFIHQENDILIAETFSQEFFKELGPAELCGATAMFVIGEQDKGYGKIPRIKNKQLFNLYHSIRRLNDTITALENHERVPAIHNQRSFSLKFVELAVRWSNGADLEELIRITSMLEGDIVNYLRRTLNLIQQLRIILFKLGFDQSLPFGDAIESLRRSYVITQLDEESEDEIMPDNWFTGLEKDALLTGTDKSDDFENEDTGYPQYKFDDENSSLPKLREKVYRPKRSKHSKKDKY